MKQKTKFKESEIGKIPVKWEVKKLGKLGTLKNGINYNKRSVGKGLEVVSVKQLFRGEYVSLSGLGSVRKEKIPNYQDYLLKDGDLLFARSSLKRVGAGKLAIVKNLDNNITVFSGFIIRFRNNSNNLEEYLSYLLRSPRYRELFPRIATGTTITNLTQEILKNVPIILPSLKEQKAIAKILSDLDSKIELNQQMNQTLEAIGQTIFKHWFIDFEFPNEEGNPYKSSGGEMIDSELGEIPKEWEISTVGNKLKTILGGTPSTKKREYWEQGNIPWINSGKVNEFRIIKPTNYITQEAFDSSATKLMSKGTTVLAITGATLGQVSRIEIKACANQSVVGIIENKEILSEYIYLWVKHKIKDLIATKTGGAQQHINKNNVDQLKILIPDKETVLKFSLLIKPIFDDISKTCFEIERLSQIRDLLLLQLMSGKIRVPIENE